MASVVPSTQKAVFRGAKIQRPRLAHSEIYIWDPFVVATSCTIFVLGREHEFSTSNLSGSVIHPGDLAL